MNVLHLGRHRKPRAFAHPPVDPGACRCPIHHPVTPEERSAVVDAWYLALWRGDADRVDYLRLQLTTQCKTAQVMCRCGCGRPLHEHVVMQAVA